MILKRCTIALLLVALAVPSQAQFWKKKGNAEPKADTTSIRGLQRFEEVLGLIDANYVTTPDCDKLSETAINSILKELDPHSMYIPAKDVARANEGLQGNFEGVGISFQIVKDTIVVSDVIAGGPSERVGIAIGDKFIKINDTAATGDSINNSFVTKHLRGKKGSKVVVEMLRGKKTYTFTIVRDKIPIYSIDSHFMVDDTIGYIRLIRFSRTSVSEFHKALSELKKEGMTALILDLRGNTGGFLDIACGMANEFLNAGSLLVYTEGRMSKRQNFVANRSGNFRTGRLVVLIDENSASASEIVSGAIQDWDRGTIVGRRSFGKGLVQRMFPLKDGGQVRITTARYYTPSGRCIQKPYDSGTDEYRKDIAQRLEQGELVNADSVHFPDSLLFKTKGGRTVYGGGGIMPDVFVPMDTVRLTDHFIAIRGKGLINTFPAQWADKHRGDSLVADFDLYLKHYGQLHIDSLFNEACVAEKISPDSTYLTDTADWQQMRYKKSAEYLALLLKAQVARNLFGAEYYYLVMRDIDEGYQKAVAVLREKPKFQNPQRK